jgi:hypothetical protein
VVSTTVVEVTAAGVTVAVEVALKKDAQSELPVAEWPFAALRQLSALQVVSPWLRVIPTKAGIKKKAALMLHK